MTFGIFYVDFGATATRFVNIFVFFPKQSFSVGVLAAKEAPMAGGSEVACRKTVVFMRLRGHDLTHSAAVSLAIFSVL